MGLRAAYDKAIAVRAEIRCAGRGAIIEKLEKQATELITALEDEIW